MSKSSEENFFNLAKKIVQPNYVELARQSCAHNEKAELELLRTQSLPQKSGWNEAMARQFITKLALMDSNSFHDGVGVGEREGRVKNSLVRHRHFGLAHGMGRSGDIGADQPKAVGSSIMCRLTNRMTLQCLRIAGAKVTQGCLVVPMATGMTLMLVLATLRSQRRAMKKKASKVVWLRIDQKTCYKCIFTTGLEAVIVEGKMKGDFVTTDLDSLKKTIMETGADNLVCVLSTTSCFAPRVPDDVVGIAKLCKELDVPHVVNNAYGAQSLRTMSHLNEAMRTGRVDAYVQSTDKNFQVPVGGAVIGSPSKEFVTECAKMYSGRASSSPIVDLFLTLLCTGQAEYKRDLEERKRLMKVFVAKLSKLAQKHGERVLKTPKNPLSIAMTLSTITDPTQVGGKLFYRYITGPRVVKRATKKEICGTVFSNYGSHHDDYEHDYIVMSCAIGINDGLIDAFLKKLDKTLKEIKKRQKKKKE